MDTKMLISIFKILLEMGLDEWGGSRIGGGIKKDLCRWFSGEGGKRCARQEEGKTEHRTTGGKR